MFLESSICMTIQTMTSRLLLLVLQLILFLRLAIQVLYHPWSASKRGFYER